MPVGTGHGKQVLRRGRGGAAAKQGRKCGKEGEPQDAAFRPHILELFLRKIGGGSTGLRIADWFLDVREQAKQAGSRWVGKNCSLTVAAQLGQNAV